MKIGHALLGVQAIDAILYDEGKERKLPFKVKYKLSRVKGVLQEEAKEYEDERVKLINEYGDPTTREDGTETLEVKDSEKLKLFYEKLQEVLDTDITREFVALTEEELKPIEDLDVDITEDQLKVFFQYIVASK
jgi:hypothetical protein